MDGSRICQRYALIAAGAALMGSLAFASSAVTQGQGADAPRARDGQRGDPAFSMVRDSRAA